MEVSTAITKRFACKSFKNDAIPEATFRKVLALTQRAPTCFNSQPYIAVAVRRDNSKGALDLLSEAMFASNKQRVLEAPITMVFCADLEPTRLIDQMAELSVQNGYKKEDTIKKIKPPLSVVGSHEWPMKLIGLILKYLVFPLQSHFFQPAMTAMLGESTRTWSIKQAMFPASTFMLAATAEGIATAPMEGFDAQRVRKALGLPPRYLPALVICCGYPKEDCPPEKKTHRFEPHQVFFDGNYDTPYRGIEPIVAPNMVEKKKE